MYVRDKRQPLQLNKEIEICGESYEPYALIGRGGRYLCYLARHNDSVFVLKQFYPKELRLEYVENSRFFRADDYTAQRFLSLYSAEAERSAQIRSIRFIDNRGYTNNNPLVILPKYYPAEYSDTGICAFAVSECYSGMTLQQALTEIDSFGRTLRERISAALNITKGIARALQSVHNRGIIHGDISPDNTFLRGVDAMGVSEYEVLLIDFGASLMLDENGHLMDGQEALVTSSIAFGAPEMLCVIGERNGAGVGYTEYRSAVEKISVYSDLYSVVQIFMYILCQLAGLKNSFICAAVMSKLEDIKSLTVCERREIMNFVTKYIKHRPEKLSCESLIADIDDLVDLLCGHGCSANIIRRHYELKYSSFDFNPSLLPQLEQNGTKETFPELLPLLPGGKYVFTGTSGSGKTTSLLAAVQHRDDNIIPLYLSVRNIGKNEKILDYLASGLDIGAVALERLMREDSSHRYVLLADGLNEAVEKAWELNRLALELPITVIATSTFWPGYDRDVWTEIKSAGIEPPENIRGTELSHLLSIPFYRFLYEKLSWTSTDKAVRYNLQAAFVTWKLSMLAEREDRRIVEFFLPALCFNMLKQKKIDLDNSVIYDAVSDAEPFLGCDACAEIVRNRQAGAIIDLLTGAGFVQGNAIHNRWIEFFAARYISDCVTQGTDIKWDGHFNRSVLQLIWESLLGEEAIADLDGKLTVSVAKLTIPFLKTPGIFELLTRSALELYHNGTNEKEVFSAQLVNIINRYMARASVSYERIGLLLAEALRRSKNFDTAIDFSREKLQAGIFKNEHRNNIAKSMLLSAFELARNGHSADNEYSAAVDALKSNWYSCRIPESGSLYAFLLAFPDPVSVNFIASDKLLATKIFYDIARDRIGPWKYALGQVAALLINSNISAVCSCREFDVDPNTAIEEIMDADIRFTAESPSPESLELAAVILDVLGLNSTRKMLKALALLQTDSKNTAAAD